MAEFEEQIRDGVCVLSVSGEIDMASADAFLHRLLDCLDRVDSLEIDLSGVTFMDSSGLSALLRMNKAAAATGKRAVLVKLSSITARLLQVSGLDEVFAVEPPPS